MRQYVGVASLVEILLAVYRYLTQTHNTQWLSRVVKIKNKYKYLLKNNISIFKLQNFTAMDT